MIRTGFEPSSSDRQIMSVLISDQKK